MIEEPYNSGFLQNLGVTLPNAELRIYKYQPKNFDSTIGLFWVARGMCIPDHLRCILNFAVQFILTVDLDIVRQIVVSSVFPFVFSISAIGDAVLEAKLRSRCLSQEMFSIQKRRSNNELIINDQIMWHDAQYLASQNAQEVI